MPEDMPDRMPENMPDRMPEDMSDRMPEDLPVRKCINVMVGITRSKVILSRKLKVIARIQSQIRLLNIVEYVLSISYFEMILQ